MKKTLIKKFVTRLIRPRTLRIDLLASLLLLFVAALFAGCSGDDEPEPEPDPAPEVEAVERTLIVYMVANNTLGQSWIDENYVQHTDDGDDLAEMQKAVAEGALQGNRLIVMHRPYRKTAQIKEITTEGIKTLASISDETSCLTVDGMKQILARIRRLAPAERYGIVLWSHGSGWTYPKQPSMAPSLRSFGQDGQRVMNIPELATALAETAPDFVYFDCCFMGGVEVAYQLRNVTGAIVASASELPYEGMPYDRTLPYLIATEPDLPKAAEQTYLYYESQVGFYNTCTIAVTRTAPLDRLARACREYFSGLNQLTSGNDIQQYVHPNESFAGLFYDFEDYLEHLSASDTADTATSQRLAAVKSILSEAVVYKANTRALWHSEDRYGNISEIPVNRHCGLTTGLPLTRAAAQSSGYSRLQWWTDAASHLTFPD